jgi:transcriptional regulator with XRE-family HTH domain
MTPQELRDWRKALDFTQEQAAEIFGVTTRGYAKWEAGDAPIDTRTHLAAKAFLREYRSKHGTRDGRPLLYIVHAYLPTDADREAVDKYIVIARCESEAARLVANEDEIKAITSNTPISVVAEAVADPPANAEPGVLGTVTELALHGRCRSGGQLRVGSRRVKVYKFRKYDIVTDKSVVARRMATRQFIDAARGEPIEGTEIEVEPSVIDANGQAPIDIQPSGPKPNAVQVGERGKS